MEESICRNLSRRSFLKLTLVSLFTPLSTFVENYVKIEKEIASERVKRIYINRLGFFAHTNRPKYGTWMFRKTKTKKRKIYFPIVR